MAKTLYEILGVAQSATIDEIKKAFRSIAIKHHPDKTNGNAAMEDFFRSASQAFDTLSDKGKRANYDLSLAKPAFTDDASIDFQFGHKTKADTIQIIMKITLAEVVNGAKKQLRIQKAVHCKECLGSGQKKAEKPKSCSDCKGIGTQKQLINTMMGAMECTVPCNSCKGTGFESAGDCAGCGGRGLVQGDELFPVGIPAGQVEGKNLVFKGRGNAGARGVMSGDLIITIEYDKNHPFKIDGKNLIYTLPLTIPQVILGGEVEVPTADKMVKIALNPLEQRRKMKIAGRGLFIERGGSRGDVIVVVSIEVPKAITAEEKKIFETMKGSPSFNVKHEKG